MARKKGRKSESPNRAEIQCAEVEATIEAQQTTYSDICRRGRKLLETTYGLNDWAKATEEQIRETFDPFKAREMAMAHINPSLVD